MRILGATVEIRPRSTGEIIDLALVFYRTHFPLIAALTAAFGVPTVLLCAAIHHLFGQAWIAVAVFWLLLPLPQGAITLAASRLVFGTNVSFREGIGLCGESFGRFLPRRLLEYLMIISMLPFVVGYIFHLTLAFSPMVVLLEKLSGPELARRRKSLSHRGGGNVFAFDVVLAMVLTVFVAGIISVFEIMLGDVFAVWETGLRTTDSFYDPIRLGAWLLAFLMAYPAYALGWFFRYLDARILAEGWDLELGFKSAALKAERRGGQ